MGRRDLTRTFAGFYLRGCGGRQAHGHGDVLRDRCDVGKGGILRQAALIDPRVSAERRFFGGGLSLRFWRENGTVSKGASYLQIGHSLWLSLVAEKMHISQKLCCPAPTTNPGKQQNQPHRKTENSSRVHR